MSNVTQLKAPEPDLDELTEIAHKNAAARSVNHVWHVLDNEHRRLSKEGTTEVNAATFKFEAQLDDQTLREKAEREKATRAVLLAVNNLHWSTCDGKHDRDVLSSEADKAKKARKARVDSFEVARDELLAQREDTNQTTLSFIDDGKGKGETSGLLGHATKSTKTIVYASLLHMQNANVPLDIYQTEVLADLASAGVDVMDLGMPASDAVEHDEDEEEIPAGIEIDDVFD